MQGQIAGDGNSATLDTLYQVDGGPFSTPETGPYTCACARRTTAYWQSTRSKPSRARKTPNIANPPLIFSQTFPYVAGTNTIEVVSGGKVLATQTISANAPQVQVTAPAGGENVGQGGLTVTWQQSDADGDPLDGVRALQP